MGKCKKINKAGGLVIPAEIRRDWGFDSGTAVEVNQQGGKLVITKYRDKCMLCGADEELKVFKGRHFCKKCINEMNSI